jgi:hypothetical protein
MPAKRAAQRPSVLTAPEAAPVAATPSTTKNRHHTTWIAYLPPLLIKALKRYKWQLVPVAGVLLVFWAGTGAGFGSALTGLAALVLYLGRDKRLRGRMFLSERERHTAALWLAIASGWQLVALAPLSGMVLLGLLVAAEAWPSYLWAVSRKPPRPKKISTVSRERLDLWATRVAVDGPSVLQGSHVVRSSVREPAPEVLEFDVQLRDDVHTTDAATDTSRKAAERLMKLPADCARVTPVRDDSGRIHVAIAPVRHLEDDVVEWVEPVLDVATGIMPVAGESSKALVTIQRYDGSGVFHGRGCGTSGVGKSATLRILVAPMVHYRIEAAWLIDGKRGTSVPQIKKAFDWYATTEEQWMAVLRGGRDLVIDRQRRRGRLELSQWVTGDEADPNVGIYIEEASEIRRALPKKLRDEADACALTIAQQGRTCGVSLYEDGQDAEGSNIVGGPQVRGLLDMGFGVMQKPTRAESARLQQDGASRASKVDLMALPSGPGREGFAAIAQAGAWVSTFCRVLFMSNTAARAWAATVERRTLSGDDAKAVGAAYARRHEIGPEAGVPVEWVEEVEEIDAEEPEQTEEEVTSVQAWLGKVLTMTPEGLTLKELADKGAGQRGRSRRNISINLDRLEKEKRVVQDGVRWVLVS